MPIQGRSLRGVGQETEAALSEGADSVMGSGPIPHVIKTMQVMGRKNIMLSLVSAHSDDAGAGQKRIPCVWALRCLSPRDGQLLQMLCFLGGD